MKVAIAVALALALGLGLGFVASFEALQADHPTIVVEDHWHAVTTSPAPVAQPETPFHIEAAVVCPAPPPPPPCPKPMPPAVPAT